MGWIVNKDKESAKSQIIPNIASNMSNIGAISKAVQELASGISCTVGGIPSGTDVHWIGCCQRTLNNLSRANGFLYQGLENAKQLSILDWVDDDD
jgi:ribosomal protein L2